MIVQTGRFGSLTVGDDELIHMPQGVLGFPHLTKYCLVDPGDDTLILWLQSVEKPEVAFPLLEPKIFKPEYIARLSAAELRELKLENINQSAVFSILTIPADISEMSANLKAPLVINLREHLAKQVVLQENEYVVKHPMFKELRFHLSNIQLQRKAATQTGIPSYDAAGASIQAESQPTAIAIRNIPPSLTAKSLQV